METIFSSILKETLSIVLGVVLILFQLGFSIWTMTFDAMAFFIISMSCFIIWQSVSKKVVSVKLDAENRVICIVIGSPIKERVHEVHDLGQLESIRYGSFLRRYRLDFGGRSVSFPENKSSKKLIEAICEITGVPIAV